MYALVVLGCLVVLGVALVVAILGYLNSLVTKYTETQPRTLITVDASPAAQEQLKARWLAFQQSVNSGRRARSFKLSAEDLNVFLANIPKLTNFLRLRIEGDKLLGDFTVPLDQTRQAKLKGRHLNGVVTFNLKFENGFLDLTVADLEANGKPAPRWILARMQKENFLRDLERNRDVMDLLQRIDTVQVTDGFVVVTPLDAAQ